MTLVACKIEHDQRLTDSQALCKALFVHAELFEQGWSNNPQFMGQGEVLRCMLDDKLIGFLTWAPDSDEAVWWVELAWTASEYRGQGVHKMLWKELVALAEERDIRRIDGAAHVQNVAMNHVMHREGRQPTLQFYSYEVKRG